MSWESKTATMADPTHDASTKESHLDELLADYWQRSDRGQAVDETAYLHEHPEFADE